MKINKKYMLLIPILIGVMFLFPLLSALTLTTPVTGGNYSNSIINITATTTVGAPMNLTCWYNASGGTAYSATPLIVISNTSANQVYFTSATVSTAGLAYARIYNVSCTAFNQTSSSENASAALITFENGVPTISLTVSQGFITQGSTFTLSWSATDTGSGLNASTVNVTLVSPNVAQCPTQSWTSSTGAYTISMPYTNCLGTYTATMYANDSVTNLGINTPNVGLATTLIQVSASGRAMGSNTNIGSGIGSGANLGSTKTTNLPLGQTGTDVVILILVGGAAYLFFKRKK